MLFWTLHSACPQFIQMGFIAYIQALAVLLYVMSPEKII